MSMNKPSQPEDEYILREEALEKHKLALKKSREIEAAERERLRKLHFMHCPKCGMDLETVVFRGVSIDKCYHCGGSWLDAGELEQLAGKDSDILSRIVSVFKHGPAEP